jgi:hypothetical protein
MSGLDRITPGGLAERQAALVAALVSDGAPPAGFDPVRVKATAVALLRKRAGEVGDRWPTLRAQWGPQWTHSFGEWARGRPPQGSLRDGWDFALAHRSALSAAAVADLAGVEATYVYDSVSAPRPRRLPAVRLVPGTIIVQVAGRVLRVRLTSPRRARRSGIMES